MSEKADPTLAIFALLRSANELIETAMGLIDRDRLGFEAWDILDEAQDRILDAGECLKHD